MKLKWLIPLSLVLGAAPAMAQDTDNFSGPWAGISGGYDHIGVDDEDGDSSKDGITFGIALGYDFNLGGVIAGVEAELSESSVSATGSDILTEGDMLTLDVGRDIYAGIRLGVPVSDNVLLYAKGGYSNLRTTATYALDGDVDEESFNTDGYRLGVGAELNLGGPFVRGEYRYSDYGAFSDTSLETSRHQLMLTAGYRF